jgi:hypothetical protein
VLKVYSWDEICLGENNLVLRIDETNFLYINKFFIRNNIVSGVYSSYVKIILKIN